MLNDNGCLNNNRQKPVGVEIPNIVDLTASYKRKKIAAMNGTGKGMKMGRGRGLGRGGGQGRNKGGSFGPGGYCICAKCGEKVPHEQGIKCTTIKCPKCGKPMIREELLQKKK